MNLSKWLLIAALMALALPAAGQLPHEISYQGVLTDNSGNPITGIHQLTFHIYLDSAVAAPLFWTEKHTNVPLDAGLFHVMLGSISAIHDTLFDSGDRWMGITVDTDPEMSPRTKIGSVPWALRAAIADSVVNLPAGSADGHSLDADDGFPVDAVYVDSQGRIGLGTTTPADFVEVYNDTNGLNILSIHNPNSGSSSGEILSFQSETPGEVWIGSYDDSHNFDGALVIANGRMGGHIRFICELERMRLDNNGNLGIGTMTPSSKLDVNGVAKMTGFKLPTGAANGYVLTSDGDGDGSWVPPSAIADSDWIIDVNDMYSGASGNVGIGTDGPQEKLHVAGDDTIGTIQVSPDGLVDEYSELFLSEDRVGTYGMKIRYNGTTNRMEFHGKASSNQYGPHLQISRSTPRVEISNASRSAVFNMSNSGDNSVALPGNAISDLEIGNEAGIANTSSGGGPYSLDGSLQTILSRSITVPSAGYVFIIGSLQTIGIHASGSGTQLVVGVSDSPDSIGAGNYYIEYIPPLSATGNYFNPTMVQGVFEVTGGGSETYYLLAQETEGNIYHYDRQLTLLFVPTAYGTVGKAAKTAGGGKDDTAVMTAADIEAERREANTFHAARLQRELDEVREKLKALEERMVEIDR